MITEMEWVERLYNVRSEPDKLLIMITNRRQELNRSTLVSKSCQDGALKLYEVLKDRRSLAEKLRNFLPQCGKQDMTNRDKDLVDWVESILAEPGNAKQQVQADSPKSITPEHPHASMLFDL